MPRKVVTTTGIKDVIDRKVVMGDGTHRNVLRRVQRQADGSDKILWQRKTPTPANLTTWHPRWAKIDLDAGYTTFAYTDENGAAAEPDSNYYETACTGTCTHGAVYYWNNTIKKMFKRDMATGVVNVLFEDTSGFRYSYLRINEETGAAVAGDAKIASSVEALVDAPAITNPNNNIRWTGNHSHWINNLVLIGNRIHDSSGRVVCELPITWSIWSSGVLSGNDTDGYFLGVKRLGTPPELYAYDWETNTLELIFQCTGTYPATLSTEAAPVVDTQRRGILLGHNVGEQKELYRTTDGQNFTQVSGLLGSYGHWLQNHFQHINMNHAFRCCWDGNTDTAFNGFANNTLFPGYVASSTFYAGKHMLVHSNRLWNIVAKT